MMKLSTLLPRSARALVVVAHPDDETIWMGGTILLNPEVRWTIVCLTRASDADRAPKFRRVCERYKAEPIIADLDDERRLTIRETLPLIERIVRKAVPSREFDVIFTHGAKGEYGHPRHKGAHRSVSSLWRQGKLSAATLACFHYQPVKGVKHRLEPAPGADCTVKLSKKIFTEKRRIQSVMHGYPMDGIDVGYCTKIESFIVRQKKLGRSNDKNLL